MPFVGETALLWHTSLLNSHRGFIVGMAVAYMPDLRLSRNTSTTQASDAWCLQFWGQNGEVGCSAVGVEMRGKFKDGFEQSYWWFMAPSRSAQGKHDTA